jgi:hypothetical protein
MFKKKQKLICVITANSTRVDYTSRNIQTPNSMRVSIKSLAGVLPPIQVPSTTTILELTELVRQSDSAYYADVMLRFMKCNNDGDVQELTDQSRTLCSYGFVDTTADLLLVAEPFQEFSEVLLHLLMSFCKSRIAIC